MALNATRLANGMRSAMGFPPGAPSAQLVGFAQGVVQSLQAATASVAAPAGNPIFGVTGAGVAGIIQTEAGYPSITAELLGFGTGFANTVGTSTVTYTIFRFNGFIVGFTGPLLATNVAAAAGYPSVSPRLLSMCTAIAAEVAQANVNDGIIS